MSKKIQRRPISALELRCTAGCAPERRGSALLIVIGTLALVAVFAAVYVSIGRTDRRAANALKSRIEQRDNSINVGEYLAGVIGDDRLDAYVQYDVNLMPFGRREVTDAPYTDWTRRSEVTSGNEHLLFTPTGGPFEMSGSNALNDYRVASDPWLASTTPSFLGNPGDPSLATGIDERPFSNYEAFDDSFPNSKNFLDQRDWLQISNFAPDGRPVNLYNLRPNLPPAGYRASTGSASDVGGFDSEPGFGTSPRADGRSIRRMSNFLSLLNQSVQGDPQSLLEAFDPAADGVWVPGYNVPQDIGITGADLWNVPAVWTMYQRFMFMPMNQPFVINNRLGNESTWADPDFPLYQYADADGDGFADSRWFELLAARDENEGNGTQNREDIQTLYEQGEFRYFIAARAVDLSSMVNVNTATDQLVPPTLEYPLGLTPADVDLRRLLTMQDQAGDHTSYLQMGGAGTSGISLSLGAAHRPYVANDQPQFGPTTPAASAAFEDRNLRRNVTDYWNYKHQWNSSPQDPRNLASDSTAMLVGRYAYDALKRSINLGGTLGNDFKGFNLEWSGVSASARTDLLQFQTDPLDTAPLPAQITQDKRFEQYMRVGRLDPINSSLSSAVTDASNTYGSGLYGLDDLTELLTYHGLNDPDFTSRLERVADGRYSSPFTGVNDDTLQTRRLGPLFSNRPLSLDRFQHGLAMADITQNPNTPPTYDNPGLREINGRVSFNSMAMMSLSPRRRMTTVSGFVPLSPDERLTDAAVPVALNGASVLQPLSDVMTNANQLFGIYAGALAGEVDEIIGTNWITDPAMFEDQEFSTLFYGHRGPELSLRIAAHAAVNATDLADGDGEVTVATLLVDSQRRTDLTNQNNFDDPELDDLYQLYPGVANGTLFDIDPNDTIPLPNSGLPDARQLVNVYGVEATPVITEVSTLYIYHDTAGMRLGGPGDEDYDTMIEPRPQGGSLVRVPADGEPPNITIHGARDTNNPDYLGQVLAFQLHNPYGVSISLGGNGLGSRDPLTRQRNHNDETTIDQDSNYQFDYYIEFAGRFYKLAEYIEWYPTDLNGENFYAIDNPLTTDAYNSVPNPEDAYPAGNVGGYMQPGSEMGGAGTVAGDYMNQAPFSDFITRNVVLQPGETRVFYVLAEKRFDDLTPTVFDSDALDDKWARTLNYYGDLNQNFQVGGRDDDLDGLPDGAYGDSRGWTGPAEQWVRKQLHVRRHDFPIMMMEFDPRDGKLVNESIAAGPVADPTIAAPSPLFNNRNDASEVRLWKKITTTGEETDEQDTSNMMVSPTYRNLMQNDLLVDRLTLPESLAMELNLAGAFPMGTDVANTVSYRDDLPRSINGRQIRNDNTGITVVNWKSIRRVDSETADLVDEPELGEVTPWMLRSANNAALAPIVHSPSLVVASELDGSLVVDNNSTAVADTPISAYFETFATLRDLVDVAASTNGEEVVQTLALAPHFKSDPLNDPGGLIEDDAGNLTIDKFVSRFLPVTNTALEDRDAIIFTGGDEPINAHPRLADLLLAWGIGPSFSPDPLRTAGSTDYVANEWQTLSEAMAVALGFDDLATVAQTESQSIWQSAWDTTTQQGILEDGHLALDRFVPFLNQTIESPIEFTVGDDILRGSGVPMALGVIDRARAIEPLERVTDPINPSGQAMTELELTRPTFGTININTAPVEVLRLLPGLTPSRAQYVKDAVGGLIEPEWWGANLSYPNLELPDLSTTGSGTDVLVENPDVAAAIVAYRDRTFGYPNTAAHPNAATAGSENYFDQANETALFFSVNNNTLNLGSVAENYLSEDPVNNLPASVVNSMDRRTFTGIDGLRLTPGFGSLGELLAVQLDPEFETSDMTRWQRLRHLSIQQLGYDDRAQGIDTGPDGEITILPQVFGNNQVGSTVDDYAEKLAMANSVVNMLSVRSDYYAVWFVLQGYKESDVANLRPEDPMIPSLHKRYLMVVDRSNVVEPGDKPKIVLLKEIPL